MAETLRHIDYHLKRFIGCVSAGLGISLLPRSVVERTSRYHQVRAHQLGAEVGRAETLFITRKGSVRSAALERFIELLAARIQEKGRRRRARGIGGKA